MSETITGEVVKTFFSEPYFTAGKLMPSEGNRPVSFSGKFGVSEGQVITLSGKWITNPKYGKQFEASDISLTIPPTLVGMVYYIQRDKNFKGVGPVYARKLVEYCFEHYNGDMDAMVSNGITEIGQELSIPESSINTFATSWVKLSGVNSDRQFLASFELTPHQIDTIMAITPSVVGMIQENPYLISKHAPGFGFKKCDEIAMKLGIPKTHPGRICAGLEYTVKESINAGNTWIEAGSLLRDAEKLLHMDTFDAMDSIRREAANLIEQEKIVCVPVGEKHCVTFKNIYRAEKLIHEVFTQESKIMSLNTLLPNGLTEGQQEAFRKAFEFRYSIISGGAGTGKTHVIGQIVTAMDVAGLDVILAAPTGKAARRMSELLLERYNQNLGSSTIHRLLGYNGFDYLSPSIPGDVIILDEFSMVDVELFYEVLKRIKPEQRLILVGDHNQLPSVGPGSILRDLISYPNVPATILDQVMRQAGTLKENSMAVLAGKVLKSDDERKAWVLLNKYGVVETMAEPLRDMVLDYIPQQFDGIDIFTDVQVITPTHKGPIGTKGLNNLFQQALNERDGYRRENKLRGFHLGDKVMQTKNDYDLGVMNGTQGVITSIGSKAMEVEFYGEGNKEIGSSEEFANLQLSYAITCHKSQGSEWPIVIVVLHKSHYFADRNWLYTAVTRASQTCIIIGDAWGIRAAAGKDNAVKRNTFLDLMR